ncbi:MAG: arsenate reductase ArsC [Candidatus Riflebacteria bacterium]|nr:arsenate reductase ArsC [Candidatus Riflebacteria bacterium]
MRHRLLFLCTGNSCRSQMAEGWTQHLWSDLFEVHSAGLVAHGLNKNAVKVMDELNIDISRHFSKSLSEISDKSFDFVITVCDLASESCPIFAGQTKRFHQGFQDPPKLAENAKSEEDALNHYRKVRDEIGEFVKKLPSFLQISS